MANTGARSFEDIKAWQLARVLVRDIYILCRHGDVSTDWGFRNQICRAAVSIMNNIAEGFARNNDKEFARYLDIARGSANEVKSMLYTALDIGYCAKEEFQRLLAQVNQVISTIGGFSTYLRKTLAT